MRDKRRGHAPQSDMDRDSAADGIGNDGLTYLEKSNGNHLLAIVMWLEDRKWPGALKLAIKILLIILVTVLAICMLCWPFGIFSQR